MSQTANDLRAPTSTRKWYPVPGSRVLLPELPGWVLQLTHNGEHTLLVGTNGRAVFTLPAADA